MNITQNTRISELINHNKDVIEALASINKHFEKLRNPILRKVLASRVTIADAAKIGNSDVKTFFEKLQPLGFTTNLESSQSPDDKKVKPDFMKELNPANVTELDVRPILDSGKDPFNVIMDVLRKMPQTNILKLVNSFEAVPLIKVLQGKGFEHYTEEPGDKLVHTYFKRTAQWVPHPQAEASVEQKDDFDQVLNSFGERVTKVDVRELEMPQPMVTILKALESLPDKSALFVQHKKIPQYLLPELAEKGFKWRIKEISEGNVQLVIFK